MQKVNGCLKHNETKNKNNLNDKIKFLEFISLIDF